MSYRHVGAYGLIEMESDDPANALPSTDKAVKHNDDMMILVDIN